MTPPRRPWGIEWRASPWFTTLVVGISIATDTLIYSLPVPVVPFQLQRLHYRDVSSLTGWLLFAFSAAGAASTLPIAALSERYSSRQPPLIAGLILLIGSQVMFMEAPTYWVMVLARVIQGISATIVWVVGLALLCDAVPESEVGGQLGLAMIGMPVGLMLGAPVGGALYKAFGFRGPFIFGSGLALVDIVGRLLVIERKDALPWLPPREATQTVAGASAAVTETEKAEAGVASSAGQDVVAAEVPRLSFLGVCKKMVTSPRAITFAFGVCAIQMTFTMTEPTMPLHLQHIWHLDSTKVGLVNLALVVPALISSPLAGVLCDKIGIKWVVAATTCMAIPWWFVATISKSLVLFVACVAMLSFWISGFIAAAVAECANFSQTNPGVGYAHAYGVQQLAVSLGNGIGPILGGLVYDHAERHGWRDVCFIAAGLSFLVTILALFFSGETQTSTHSPEKTRASDVTIQTE